MTAIRRPLTVELRRAVSRFRHITPWRVVSDLRRAARLRRSAPLPRPRQTRSERLVVTLTTVPERVDHIVPVLRSLLDQTCPADRILLAWPSHSARDGRDYRDAPSLPEGIELLPCADQGPATKLLPALLAEPAALLVAVDDDVIYPVDFLATLLKAHRTDRHSALGWRGARIEPGVDPRDFEHIFATAVTKPTQVDLLMATWGYLVPPGALDAAVHDFTAWPPELRWVDDVWISGHLARRGVSRRVVPGRGLPLETGASSIAALNRGPNSSGQNARIALDAFRQWW